MVSQLIKFLLVSILLIVFCLHSISQQLMPDTLALPAYTNAVAFYNQSLKEELHLFNGKEDKGYQYEFNYGTPYFLTANWSKGTLNYDGKMYENVSLLYDVARDEIVYLYFDNRSRIQLAKEKVIGFSIMDHDFVHIAPDSLHTSSIAPGFYDQLYHGKISLLSKRTKNIQTYIRQSGEEFKVFSKDHYYIKKGNDYIPVSNKRSLLHSVDDNRKELQQYIRQNRLNFKKDMENAMIKTLAFYNQLITR